MFRTQKMLAIFLSVVLFFGAFSVATPVFAENVTDAIEHYEFVQNAINNPAVAEQTTPEAEITFEVEEKRDEYTKVYKKDDGTYTAVMSAEPLHYLKDGEWEEINNSLLPNGDTYSNAENSFTVEVPENINSNENLTVEKDGYEISFSVEGISESSAVVENNIVTSETQVPLADEAITQTQSSVTYSDIAENTALQYVVTPNSIKENIIVSNKESVKETYTFTFETNGLNVDKQDDGSVEFKSESGDVKFRIPRPVMTDSAQAFSYDIAVVLVYNTDGTVTLKYSPSQEWINSTDRVYPINIDPAIEVGDKDSTWVEDTYVLSYSSDDTMQNQNFYNEFIGSVANRTDETLGHIQAEIYTRLNMEKFNALGNNIIFTEVQYLLWGTSTDGKAIAREINDDIDFSNVTYATKPQNFGDVIDYYTAIYTGETDVQPSYAHFNITKPFNEWFNGETNKGFAILPGNENFYGLFIVNGTQPTINGETAVYTTTLVLDYVDLGGYNPKYEYDKKYIGRAGTSYVNLLTQQLTVIRDDFSIQGENQFTLGMMFDSATSKKLQEMGHTGVLAYGNNWVPNYLRAYLFADENHVTYYTQTGCVVEFLRSTDSDGNTVFTELLYGSTESSGYGFEYHPATVDSSEFYTVTRPDGHIEKFNSFGLLVSETISGNPEGSINIQYDNKSRIDSITDVYGGTYDYAYEDKGLVSTVTYTSPGAEYTRTINYEHDRYNNLTRIEAVDENNRIYVCGYEYDINGNMSEIIYGAVNEDDVVVDDVGIRYTYDDNGRITTVTELSYNGTEFVGDAATVEYNRVNSTQVEVVDSQNAYKLYYFDITGNLLYTYDDKNSIIFYENSISPIPYTLDNRKEINVWNGDENLNKTNFEVGLKSGIAIEMSGGINENTTITQTVTINGEQGDEILVSSWFNGFFTKSVTNNKWLLGVIENEDTPYVNFTNERIAQIEIWCNYDGMDKEDNQDKVPDIVIPFVENVDDWRLVADRFTLMGDCDSITVVVRYSNNVNPARISCVEVVLNKKWQLNYEGDVLTGVYKGLKNILSYEYTGNGQVAKMTYYNDSNEKTTFVYEYSEGKITGIKVNDKLRHQYEYENGHVSKILSADNRIVRYVDKNTPIPTFTQNLIYAMENDGNAYIETIGGLAYTTAINEDTYTYDTEDGDFKDCFFTESSNTLSESGKGIGVQLVQDWYGRRISDTIQLKDKDGENEELFAKLETKYGYGDELSFGTLNDIKTYTNTIYIPSQQSALSENYSFLYEYDENGNVIEEYNYISENSMELHYSYQYNDKNQLVRYNDNVSDPKRSYTYTYDDSGRVLSKSTYAPLGTELGELISTENYEYNGNVLTEYGNNHVENNVSNYPTSYEGATLTWTNNQLTSYTYTENDENSNPIVKRISYTYDENGYLSSKLVETKKEDSSFTQSEKYDYTWAYGKVINQVHTSYENGAEIKTVIKFVYDSYNSVQGFIVNDTASYIYLKNLQGDIIGVVNEAGEVVASYSYDVWGKQTVTTTQNIVGLLPLAYRGYFFDNYANLYFIDKRAYNPEWGKFLDSASAEAEGLPEIAEYNMYTYWENNPVWYMTEEEKEAYEANSVANYWHNKKVTVENFAKLKEQQGVEDDNQVNTFIYDQTLDEINQYRCGVVTSRPKGCGWIATYNASKLLGYNFKPECVIWEYEKMGIFMQGFFGVHPFAVARFFTKRGHDIDVHFGDFVDLDNLNSLSEVNVMFYDGKPTGHYAAIQYKNNVFEGYNVFGSTAVEPLGNSIYDPGKAEDNTLGVYTGKVLISISPKE